MLAGASATQPQRALANRMAHLFGHWSHFQLPILSEFSERLVMATRTLRLTRALVDKVPKTIPDPGPIAEIAELQTDDARASSLTALLASRPDQDAFWVFAFGSLMWKPDIAFHEQRRAQVKGWHRAFCLGPDTRYRGNPEYPGLMLSLDQGGVCEGVAFRLDEGDLAGCLENLIAREPPIPPVWVDAETAEGSIRTLAFVCDPGGRGYVGGLTPEEIAAQIAPAVGMFGSMADYVLNTATHLDALAIQDSTICQMQNLVASELEKMP
jgi:cation transport protein ChaC